MPLNISDNLPAIELLLAENIFALDTQRSSKQDIRPLKIGVLNLMPLKIETETDLIRLLSNSPLQIELTLVKTNGHISKNTPEEHINEFYVSFDSIKNQKFDGFIITGAPVEMMAFEEVDYWSELTEILDWTKKSVTSTFHICWAAQAGMYHHYGVKKELLPEKKFGVFEHRVCIENHPLFRGFDDTFFVPHSRHTTISEADVANCNDLTILAVSDEAGIYIVSAHGGRELYVTGHSEYTALTLNNEYKRDLAKGMNTAMPENYYKNNDSTLEPMVRWRAHANLLYTNWLNYFVYQETPFNIEEIK